MSRRKGSFFGRLFGRKEEVKDKCSFCGNELDDEGTGTVFMSGSQLHTHCVVQHRRVMAGGKPGAKPKQTSLIEQYELLSQLGSGSFATVWKAKHKASGDVFAIKVIGKWGASTEHRKEMIERERSIMRETRAGPFLASSVNDFDDDDNVYLVMQCAEADLFTLLKATPNGLGVAEAVVISSQIVLALEYLHANNILYRDLKPENVLIRSANRVLLTDFGISKQDSRERAHTYGVGTPLYFAPEVIRGEVYGVAIDFWALGVIIFEIISGRSPFFHHAQDQVVRNILQEEPDYSDESLSDEAISLTLKLLRKDPSKRLSDFVELKQQPFYSSVDWKQLLREGAPETELDLTDGLQVDEGEEDEKDDPFADFDQDCYDEEVLEDAPPSPKERAGLRVKAIESWAAEDPEEMDLDTGEIIFVTRQTPDGWWEGEDEQGQKKGIFPATFVVTDTEK